MKIFHAQCFKYCDWLVTFLRLYLNFELFCQLTTIVFSNMNDNMSVIIFKFIVLKQIWSSASQKQIFPEIDLDSQIISQDSLREFLKILRIIWIWFFC